MKKKKLTGSVVPRFTYDTPHKAENDFYALCEGECPLVVVVLANFGHPISRAFLAEYFKTLDALDGARLACVVRSNPQNIAQKMGAVQFPFPLICDAEGVLYDYFEVEQTASALERTLAARRIVKKAKEDGYVREKGALETLPLTMVFGKEGKILYAHRGRSLTDMPEDCFAVNDVCALALARQAKKDKRKKHVDESAEDEWC